MHLQSAPATRKTPGGTAQEVRDSHAARTVPFRREVVVMDKTVYDETVELLRTVQASLDDPHELQRRVDRELERQTHREIESAMAYHEAGHAVVACALGQDVSWIGIDDAAGEDWGGRMSHSGPLAPGQRAWASDELAIALAGKCAGAMRAAALELPMDGELPPCVPWADSNGDWLHRILENAPYRQPDAEVDSDEGSAATLLLEVPDDEREEALHKAHATVREILEREWVDVEAIASCL